MKRLAILATVAGALAPVAAGTAVAASFACGQVLEPGRYQLTGDLDCSGLTVGEAALVINSTGAVTIDLNGYGIKGPGATSGTAGIRISGGSSDPSRPRPAVTLMNGLIRGFESGISGVNTDFDATNMRIADNGAGIGIFLASTITLKNSFITNNAGDGIVSSSGGNAHLGVYDSRITGNRGNGISLYAVHLEIERSAISHNGAYGIYEEQFGARLTNNTIDANGQDGAFLGRNDYPDHYSLLNNSFDRNDGHGIVYAADVSVLRTHPLDAQGNTARNNGTDPQCVNIDCTLH